MARKPSFDLQMVREAAAGRWSEILTRSGGISPDVLDGKHHACPKCGGTDRFRAFDNFQESGGLICNQCHREKNGSGFDSLIWLNGWSFQQALKAVADYLGIKPDRSRKAVDPAALLEFLPWNETLVALWCLKKPPIKPASIQAVGGRVARYRNQYTVIALPVWGSLDREADPVGWCLINITGGELPIFKDRRVIGWTKVKLTHGSRPGLIAPDVTSAKYLWKTEGPTDLLALLSREDLPQDHLGVCNAFGAGEKPIKCTCLAEVFSGRSAIVVHDADKPGESGAEEWTNFLATVANSSKHVNLPYPVVVDHGKDLRDYFNENHSFVELLELAAAAIPIDPTKAQPPKAVEADDDPHRLARINLERYALHRDGATLRFWRDEWYTWKPARGCYRQIPDRELRAKISQSIKEEFDRLSIEWQLEGRDDITARKVTSSLVNNVLAATSSLVVISSNTEPMTWLDGQDREKRSYVAMRNGILDLEALMSGEEQLEHVLLPHSPNWFSTVCLPYDFDPDADCPRWKEFLKTSIKDPRLIDILQEWAGYLLLPTTDLQKFLVMEGEGNNGKSVFCAGITAILGADNVSNVPLESFSGRFDLNDTIGKLVNIVGDTNELDKVAEGRLKSFVSGDRMFFDRKGIAPISTVPTARLMMACNNRPRFNDRSDGIWRRMLIVPFETEVEASKRVLGMDKAVWWESSGELPGMLAWAIAGLFRLRTQGTFTKSETSEIARTDYREETNPARQFLESHFEPAEDSKTVTKSLIYDFYKRWCGENGFKPLNVVHFSREVYRVFKASKPERKKSSSDNDKRVSLFTAIKFKQGVEANGKSESSESTHTFW